MVFNFIDFYFIFSKDIGTLHTLFIILILALIISMGYGIMDGFENYNYPVLHIEKVLQSFKRLSNYLERDMENHGFNDLLR